MPEPFWRGLVDVAPADGGGVAAPEHGGAVRVDDTALPDLARRADGPLPVAVVLSGGAGQVAGPAALCTREAALHLRRLEVTLRDPSDLAGNARRVVAAVDAARGEGALAEDAAVHVAVPDAGAPGGPGHGWLAAADELSAAELGLVLDAAAPPPALVALVDAALDRELPFTVRADAEALPGLLAATALLFDGEGPDAAADALAGGDAAVDADLLRRGRRWLRAATVPDAAAAVTAYAVLDPA